MGDFSAFYPALLVTLKPPIAEILVVIFVFICTCKTRRSPRSIMNFSLSTVPSELPLGCGVDVIKSDVAVDYLYKQGLKALECLKEM